MSLGNNSKQQLYFPGVTPQTHIPRTSASFFLWEEAVTRCPSFFLYCKCFLYLCFGFFYFIFGYQEFVQSEQKKSMFNKMEIYCTYVVCKHLKNQRCNLTGVKCLSGITNSLSCLIIVRNALLIPRG